MLYHFHIDFSPATCHVLWHGCIRGLISDLGWCVCAAIAGHVTITVMANLLKISNILYHFLISFRKVYFLKQIYFFIPNELSYSTSSIFPPVPMATADVSLIGNNCSSWVFSTWSICGLIDVLWTLQVAAALIHLNIHCVFGLDVTVMSSDCWALLHP